MLYINAVVHKSFLEVVDDRRLDNLLQQDHVFDSTLLDIVALPVVWLVQANTQARHNNLNISY